MTYVRHPTANTLKVMMTALLSAALLSAALCTVPVTADAQIRGEIVGPSGQRTAVAVPESTAAAPLPDVRRFAETVRRDLELSMLASIVEPGRYPAPMPPVLDDLSAVDFAAWGTTGTRALLHTRLEVAGEGYTVEVRLLDVVGRNMLGGRLLRGSADDLVRLAHRSADAVLEILTGVRGPFDSSIAFVSDRAGHAREIYLYEFGGGVRRVTHHESLVMAPSWHPGAGAILFTSFRGGRPALYELNLPTREETRLASKMGLNIGGAWSPDGRLVAVAREERGNTDIYALDFENETQWTLTDHWGIDFDPSWSPDSRSMAFCSSRGGTPQVYTMSVAEKSVRRLTFEGGYNCSPAWSPDGRSIAYVGRVAGRFQIFVVPAAGGKARQLTTLGSNEEPTWSPDNRYLAFSGTRGGQRKLYLVDVALGQVKQLTFGDSEDKAPAWSRRLD